MPNDVKTHKFEIERYLYLDLYWQTNFSYIMYKKSNDPRFFDKQSSDNFEMKKRIEYKIEPNIASNWELIQRFNKIKDEAYAEIKKFYKARFAEAILVNDLNLFAPRLSITNGRFQNHPGKVLFRGLTFTEKFKETDEDYERLKNKMFGLTILYAAFNFDRDLHEILGFDNNFYPNYKFITTNHGLQMTTVNDGIASQKADLNWFNLIYVYCDVLQESFIGDQKANLLKVFSRRTSENQETITYNFTNLMFIPLRVTEFNSIRFLCCDTFGNIADYSRGHIALTLLIRPRLQHV